MTEIKEQAMRPRQAVEGGIGRRGAEPRPAIAIVRFAMAMNGAALDS
jgi:hypothetical protein